MIDPDVFEVKMAVLQIGVQAQIDETSKKVYWSELSKVMDTKGFERAVDALLTGEKPFFRTIQTPFPTIPDIRKACPDEEVLSVKAKSLWRDVESCLMWGSRREANERREPKEGRFERAVELWVQRTFGGWLKAFEKFYGGYSSDFKAFQRPFVEELPGIQREVFIQEMATRPRLGPAEIQKKLVSL